MNRRLPPSISGWKHHYDAVVKFIRQHGRMSGDDADRMARDLKPALSRRSRNHDIGDILGARGSAHVYRLQRFVQHGVLRRRIMGTTTDRVFYYLPLPKRRKAKRSA